MCHRVTTETYHLPSHWAVALINDDRTGLTDEDEKDIEKFLAERNPGVCVDVHGQEEFSPWHDAPGVLPCAVREFTFTRV